MKNINFKWPLLFATFACALSSCESDLEIVPIEQQVLEQVFDTKDSAGVNANRFLTDCYRFLPETGNRVGGDFLDAGTDDALSSNPTNTSVQQLALGTYTADSYPDNRWGSFYRGIRKTNIFIHNIDRVPLKGQLQNGTPLKRVWKAEAKFLRALFYFELLKRHGGIPLLGDEVYQLDDNIELSRSSFQQCVDYIAAECDAIKDSLRTDPFDLPNYGRPTKAAALALKSRLLLYAASPLFNGENIDGQNPLTGYADFSIERWQLAENAAMDVMDLNLFLLESEFTNVFITRNKERIFAKQGDNNTSVENNNGPVGYAAGINNGRTSPTQELVDAFGMENGLDITDPNSGYNAEEPYLGRDKRFYATVFYNGAMWLGRPVETFEGGSDKPGGSQQQTKTGYYLRKFMGDFESSVNYSNVNHDHILFRYGEILLNFAEARNERLSAPDGSVYAAVERIRERAGLAPFALAGGLSKSQMREIIRQERRKELAFEEHRFYDVRRWKIAEDQFDKELHAAVIYQTSTGTIRQTVPVLQMKFETRMYLAPIPFSEVIKNPQMEQNPGW
ncbi:MAG: RagB/SusD family nutrient uptake outer membrane protein [Sphingobacterium sp.]|uniref:RagB/SusD family nutrient uptake outer membrane protein n=1 Tax=Sphingobacterium sp. JB170 TaxID=1434842 RepID=UPI00097ECB40|nr:RagB/SusD family nutrient uptake outer membrane protein [Sphingobacterium sp. JB170]SJN47090.1 putative outer membrane protein, probably involved in nutrient binding [Sphingobacterium sp. JB170]